MPLTAAPDGGLAMWLARWVTRYGAEDDGLSQSAGRRGAEG